MQQVSPTLIPLPLTYVPDSQLKEGRLVIPLLMDFSQNNQLDISGNFYTSKVQVQTANVKGTTILSSVKGVVVKFNTYNNQVLVMQCQETAQEWVFGVPFDVGAVSENFIVNARVPMFLPQSATLNFINYSLTSDPPTSNIAQVHLCNFEVRPFLQVVRNPFGAI